jgi:hypothetical protein
LRGNERRSESYVMPYAVETAGQHDVPDVERESEPGVGEGRLVRIADEGRADLVLDDVVHGPSSLSDFLETRPSPRPFRSDRLREFSVAKFMLMGSNGKREGDRKGVERGEETVEG